MIFFLFTACRPACRLSRPGRVSFARKHRVRAKRHGRATRRQKPIYSIRRIRRIAVVSARAANEHHCRRVAGGPFDLRGTLAGPLGLEAHSCLLALSTSFLTFSTVHVRGILSRPRQHPRRSDFLRLWDTCTANSSVSTCINHENRFPPRARNDRLDVAHTHERSGLGIELFRQRGTAEIWIEEDLSMVVRN